LKVADESVQADGTQHHLSYGLNLDGAEHPNLTGRADTITAMIKGTSLETVLRKEFRPSVAGLISTNDSEAERARLSPVHLSVLSDEAVG
jgi:hypothetical protein